MIPTATRCNFFNHVLEIIKLKLTALCGLPKLILFVETQSKKMESHEENSECLLVRKLQEKGASGL